MSSNKPDFRPLLLRLLGLLALFTLCFFAGRKVAMYTEETISPVASATENWGLGFQTDGERPTANASIEELKKYNAYYAKDTKKKEIYLTFDCGFENGNTEKILDALKEHNVKACFFLVGNYMEKEPELVKRMEEEGHIVGNHTYHHKDMASITSREEFLKELTDLESLYEEITGCKMKKYYRPPQGKYSKEQLTWAMEAGYKTVFWSLAYVDWEVDKQPSKEEAMEKLSERIHPGSIVLLHSTSSTNGEILGDIIEKWKEMGYSFGTLEEL